MKKTFLTLLFLLVAPNFVSADLPKSRTLKFDYEVTIKDIPQDAKELKIWIPFLPEKPYQVIESVEVFPKENSQVTEDGVYGNKILNYSLKAPFEEEYAFKTSYKIKRYEFLNKPDTSISLDSQAEPLSGDFEKFLKPNRLVKLNDEIREIATTVTKDKQTVIEKAQAIYDYVFNTVSYDKSKPGYGFGDTERVCNIKAGNCTDFHSLFIALSRVSGIPAKFVIGAPFDAKMEGETVKYHCWAEFYDQQLGWVPVDISEAWKDKSKYAYHFGGLDESRLEFSQGRDINLVPRQTGESLNYFVYPYAEVDGKIHKGVGVLFKYKDVHEKVVLQKQING